MEYWGAKRIAMLRLWDRDVGVCVGWILMINVSESVIINLTNGPFGQKC